MSVDHHLYSPEVVLSSIESERIFQYEIVIETVRVIKCVDKGIYIQKRKKSEGEQYKLKTSFYCFCRVLVC